MLTTAERLMILKMNSFLHDVAEALRGNGSHDEIHDLYPEYIGLDTHQIVKMLLPLIEKTQTGEPCLDNIESMEIMMSCAEDIKFIAEVNKELQAHE